MTTVSQPLHSLLLEQYATRLRRHASHHTVKNWGIIARRFDGWLGEHGIAAEDASMADLEDYFDSLALSDSSKGTHFRMIRAAYDYAARNGRLRHNPAIDIKLRDPDPKPIRSIPPAELRQIRRSITLDRDWIFFHVLAFTGMRRAEVAALRWADGDKEGTWCSLETQSIQVFGKGRKLRTVPIHPALGDVLHEAGPRPGEYVVPSSGRNGVALDTIQAMSRRLHPEYTPHDYRRTVATSLRRHGVDDSVRNRIMGWGAKDIFQRHYDDVADAELHRGILRLYADDPIC